MVRPGLVPFALLTASALLAALPTEAQDAPLAPVPGTVFVVHDPVVIGATVPCDSARYTMAETLPAEGKAYTARSFGGAACTTSFDFTVPRAFTAEQPIVIRAVMACDAPAASGGVEGATTTVRFAVLHDGEAITGNINLVGPNDCTSTPIVFQATADLEGESFAAGDVLTLNIIPFYTTGGAGDPNKSLHLLTGGADPSGLLIPDLAAGGGATVANILYQNVTLPELRFGREDAANLTETEVYNWTAVEPTRVHVDANVTSGAARLTVKAGNTTVLEIPVNATSELNETLAEGGNLTVQVEYLNFTGSLVVQLGAPPIPSGSLRDPVNVTVEDDNTRTGGFPLQEVEETPGPGVPLALLAVAALALFARRRLR